MGDKKNFLHDNKILSGDEGHLYSVESSNDGRSLCVGENDGEGLSGNGCLSNDESLNDGEGWNDDGENGGQFHDMVPGIQP